MKWTSRHRQADSSQTYTTLPVDVHDPLDSVSRQLASSYVDLATDDSLQITPKQSPQLTGLLITKDIEALLEEDDRARAQERREQEERQAKFGRLNRVAPVEDPNSLVRGLPPPPRAHPGRHYRIQSEQRTPIQSGRPSDITGDRSADSRRPSMTRGAASPPSVSAPSSIKNNVPVESATAQRTDLTNTYTLHNKSPKEEAKLENRLSDFGPKSTCRSSGGPNRDSMGVESRFSDATLMSNATFSSSPAGPDVSRTIAQLPSRPLLSHAPLSSRESVLSTVSSYDPPSSTHESRISVSSTIYPPSAYNELPSPVTQPMGSHPFGVGNRTSIPQSELYSIHVEDQRESVTVPSAHASPDCETSGPHRITYASPVGIYPVGIEPIGGTDRALPPRPLSTSSDLSIRSASGRKPALPTTPKPDFRRSRSVQPPSKPRQMSKTPSPSSSPKALGRIPYQLVTSFSPSDPSRNETLPPTTNYLNPQERAELIRKTRKLTQVFGKTPSPLSSSQEQLDSPALTNCLLPVMASRKVHPRGAMSVSDPMSVSNPARSLRDTHFPTISGERTSSLSPIRFRSSSSGQGNESDDSLSPFDSPDAVTPRSSRKKSGDAAIRSPTIISASDSFIEMAEQDSSSILRFPSSYSFAESISEEQQAEEERRRKRERLAKLHRFLGSRVPMDLVLGPGTEVPLPPVAQDPVQTDPATVSDGETSTPAKLWARGRRRNSLASSDPSERMPESERLKEELSEKEKAIVVKRALKMEKMFGEQPPQDLFHSCQKQLGHRAAGRAASESKLPVKSAPSSPVIAGVEKYAYRKIKIKRNNRPGTAESSKKLLPSAAEFGETDSIHEEQSDVYYHYRNSLVSLTNIVDNDDRKSLVELHEYINEDLSMENRDKRESYSNSSIWSERRRSLPLRASQVSLASQFTISEVQKEITPFEVRRRRAVKLSHFFGVSYRDLFGEVLDSLEMSVREDEGKGELKADEAKDLLVQLSMLKARRDELS